MLQLVAGAALLLLLELELELELKEGNLIFPKGVEDGKGVMVARLVGGGYGVLEGLRVG